MARRTTREGAACGRAYGKLTTGQRKRIPAAMYGLPKLRKYPMPDSSHAKNAKARASQEFDRGNLTASQYAQIVRKANRIISQCRRTGGMLKRAKRALSVAKKRVTNAREKARRAKAGQTRRNAAARERVAKNEVARIEETIRRLEAEPK